MTKKNKLRLCNRMLVFATVSMLISSIQLEATGSRGVSQVWIHISIGFLFFANIVWHLYLHFGWNEWLKRMRKQKSPVTRWLATFCLLTIISAFVAFFHWMSTNFHSTIGGIHGKIGFIFLLLAIGHTIKRIKFFNGKMSARQTNHLNDNLLPHIHKIPHSLDNR